MKVTGLGERVVTLPWDLERAHPAACERIWRHNAAALQGFGIGLQRSGGTATLRARSAGDGQWRVVVVVHPADVATDARTDELDRLVREQLRYCPPRDVTLVVSADCSHGPPLAEVGRTLDLPDGVLEPPTPASGDVTAVSPGLRAAVDADVADLLVDEPAQAHYDEIWSHRAPAWPPARDRALVAASAATVVDALADEGVRIRGDRWRLLPAGDWAGVPPEQAAPGEPEVAEVAELALGMLGGALRDRHAQWRRLLRDRLHTRLRRSGRAS